MRVLNLSHNAGGLLFLTAGLVLISVGAVELIDKNVGSGVIILTIGFISFYIGDIEEED